MKKYLVFLILYFFSTPAFGYLDPGTGSMLMYAIFGIIGGIIYALKGYYYKIKMIIFKNNVTHYDDIIQKDIVFHSDSGSVYWNTFKPILKEMEISGKKCVYLTTSKDDPSLNENFKNIETKYIGEGIRALTYLNNIRANIVVTTTPQLDILKFKRSKWVKHYTYIPHSCTDVGIYAKYAFDNFDSFLCVGNHQVKHLRDLEKKRGTKVKKLFHTGCTYFDILLKTKSNSSSLREKTTVLIAPTWGNNSLLTRFGFDIIKPFLNEKYRVIIRPHPQMFISQKQLINKIKKQCNNYQDFVWDTKPTSDDSMNNSDVLISDLSSIIFDFSFIYKKPVICIDAPVLVSGLEVEDMDLADLWELKMREKIGIVLKENEIYNISEKIDETLKNHSKTEIDNLIEENIFNFGNSGKVAAEQLISISESI